MRRRIGGGEPAGLVPVAAVGVEHVDGAGVETTAAIGTGSADQGAVAIQADRTAEAIIRAAARSVQSGGLIPAAGTVEHISRARIAASATVGAWRTDQHAVAVQADGLAEGVAGRTIGSGEHGGERPDGVDRTAAVVDVGCARAIFGAGCTDHRPQTFQADRGAELVFTRSGRLELLHLGPDPVFAAEHIGCAGAAVLAGCADQCLIAGQADRPAKCIARGGVLGGEHASSGPTAVHQLERIGGTRIGADSVIAECTDQSPVAGQADRKTEPVVQITVGRGELAFQHGRSQRQPGVIADTGRALPVQCLGGGGSWWCFHIRRWRGQGGGADAPAQHADDQHGGKPKKERGCAVGKRRAGHGLLLRCSMTQGRWRHGPPKS